MQQKIQKVKDFIDAYGLKLTIKKIFKTIFDKIFKRNLEKKENEAYKVWIENNTPSKEELKKQEEYVFKDNPKISIIVPMYNTPKRFFVELVDSLIAQTYKNWELCLADGSGKRCEYIDEFLKEPRIKYKFLNKNGGISENSNEALKLATGDFYALLDHDDVLPRNSLFEVVKVINENPDVDFIYTDEDKIVGDTNERISPHFKPDFAPDTFLSYNYICHFSIIKKELMDKIGGFRKELDGSQDYDLIFRITENAKKIKHIPMILYHWRIHQNSVASSSSAKPYAYEAAKRAIAQHFDRIGVKNAVVSDSVIKGIYKVNYKIEGNPKVSIIILNKDHKKDLKKCINSILKSTYTNYEIIIVENNSKKKSTFRYYESLKNKEIPVKVLTKNEEYNFSKMNDYAVKNASGDYLIFLNNDIKIITKDWIENLVGNCQRDDVGIVGAKLLYPNNKIQHSGVVLNVCGTASHINLMNNKTDLGYMCRNVIQQNFMAVTGALLTISKDFYKQIGGFDYDFPIAYNDVDLCLKCIDNGKLVVYNSCVEAYHYESKTRGKDTNKEKSSRLEKESTRLKNKWKKYFEVTDPYFNPNFSDKSINFKINTCQNRGK